MLQPTPFALPRVTVDGLNTERRSSAEPPRAIPVSTQPGSTQPTPAQRSLPTFNSKDVVSGREAVPNATSDLGSLLKKSGSALSVGVQARTPIVSDPRIRGSRVGSLAASGSHWVPARIDLDTVLSKFDSRQIDAVEIIPGPYTTRLGPGFAFTDIQLLQSPRMTSNERWFGGTDFEYRANGNQFFGAGENASV